MAAKKKCCCIIFFERIDCFVFISANMKCAQRTQTVNKYSKQNLTLVLLDYDAPLPTTVKICRPFIDLVAIVFARLCTQCLT